ncbi:transglycosylase family protein [Streptomyces sp. TG1A-8]|uniref:transglycosylase family protein n=1 Tax=Streptomyces sp. TG1A-8 TaxID=3051385 RepID=UPI00265C04E9|nr:transglycosylase family protein [Streptomyces sp. TG1A-8]MDO0927355.1 transglycosylase family protein [Streptomyces sp. TG1A-8]
MLSGNGRHRRPRQAPALLVAAGVTGSAIAIPLLGAASASAADGTTWDKVAECESGGSWSADTGNGYYGGLQISQEDWEAHGGTRYASSADQASRSQQIAVAEKILADRGTTPWATCALLSGLTSDSGSVDVDTGVDGSGAADPGTDDAPGSGDSAGPTDSPGPAGGSDPSGPPDATPSAGSGPSSGAADTPAPAPGSRSGTDGHETGKAGKADGAGDAAKSDTSASAGPEGGGSGGPTTTGSATGDPDDSWQSGGSWSLVDTGSLDTGSLDNGGRHRGGSADEKVTNGQSAAPSGRHASRGADTYTVRRGDTLASIADSLGLDGGWHALYAANEKAVGADPNHISAGQTLEVRAETGGK